MPPLKNDTNEIGWKAFFALLGVCQIVCLGVMWRTYEAVTSTAQLSVLHDYQIREEIKPAIKDIKASLFISEAKPAQPKQPKS